MKEKKKILIFIDWFLPGFKAGGPVRSCTNLISHLNHKFEFLIVTRNIDYCESIAYKNIEANKWINLNTSVKVFYFSNDNLSICRLKNLIRSTEFDTAYINGIYSFYFSILPVIISNNLSEKKIIVSSRGMLSKGSLGVKSYKKKVFLKIAKTINLYKKVIFQATNQQEAKDIKKYISTKNKISIIPNLHPKVTITSNHPVTKEKGEIKLVCIARIAPEKNIAYALEIIKDCNFGKITFDLYGSIYNESYWNKCQKLIDDMPPNITINYHGHLDSTKVKETIQLYHFLFLPSTGENFGHVILESLMAARPVIISDTTPWKNLHTVKVGWDIELHNKSKFIDIIHNCLLFSQNKFDIYTRNSLQYATKYIADSNVIEQYCRLFS